LSEEASYRRALRAHLVSGTGRDDIQAVALDEISTIAASGAAFVPFNTLGASALQDGRLLWVWPARPPTEFS
jgi:hypothetical protein